VEANIEEGDCAFLEPKGAARSGRESTMDRCGKFSLLFSLPLENEANLQILAQEKAL
jgi:hypothetical protein